MFFKKFSNYICINQTVRATNNKTITNTIKIMFDVFSYLSSHDNFSFSFLSSSNSLFNQSFDSSNKYCDFLKSNKETEFFATSSAFQTLIAKF